MRDKQGRAAILKLKAIKLRYMRKMTGCVTFIRPEIAEPFGICVSSDPLYPDNDTIVQFRAPLSAAWAWRNRKWTSDFLIIKTCIWWFRFVTLIPGIWHQRNAKEILQILKTSLLAWYRCKLLAHYILSAFLNKFAKAKTFSGRKTAYLPSLTFL